MRISRARAELGALKGAHAVAGPLCVQCRAEANSTTRAAFARAAREPNQNAGAFPRPTLAD